MLAKPGKHPTAPEGDRAAERLEESGFLVAPRRGTQSDPRHGYDGSAGRVLLRVAFSSSGWALTREVAVQTDPCLGPCTCWVHQVRAARALRYAQW